MRRIPRPIAVDSRETAWRHRHIAGTAAACERIRRAPDRLLLCIPRVLLVSLCPLQRVVSDADQVIDGIGRASMAHPSRGRAALLLHVALLFDCNGQV